MKDKVALVVGATRGIGRALAVELARRGHKTYGGGRSWDDKEGLEFTPLRMDVREEESLRAAVEKIIAENGRIDSLIANAGISHSGAVEDVPIELAREIFETNYLGVVRSIKAVLPAMRSQKSGTIAIVGSAAGKIGVPFQAHYAASKFAVEGLAEALRYELMPFGIRVLLIEPGDVGTDIWKRSEHVALDDSPYADALSRFHKVKEKEMGKVADPPENAACQIADLIESGTTALRHPVAKGARLFLLARKLLPDSVFFWAVKRNYRL